MPHLWAALSQAPWTNARPLGAHPPPGLAPWQCPGRGNPILGSVNCSLKALIGFSESLFVWSLTQDQFPMGYLPGGKTPTSKIPPGIPGTHIPLYNDKVKVYRGEVF